MSPARDSERPARRGLGIGWRWGAGVARLAVLVGGVLCLSGCQREGEGDRPEARVVELFDGETLGGWRVLGFGGSGGNARVSDGTIQLAAGEPLSGITLDHRSARVPLPAGDYELELEAMKLDGDDFFCALTFPVPAQQTCCTLVVGGWGGTLVGISSVNGMDASHNTTGHGRIFAPRQWYHIRVRVTAGRLEAWIDDTPVVDLDLARKSLSMRPGPIEACQPIGIATYRTAAAYRALRLRLLPAPR